MSIAATIFRSLEGTWTLNRLFSSYGKMTGIATFQKSSLGHLLHYREDGQIYSTDGKAMTAFREYYYRLQNDKLSVYFAEPSDRLLHVLTFDSSTDASKTVTATAKHLCECDTYDAIYEFHLPDEFTLSYSVKGPKKDFTIKTVFQRTVPKFSSKI